MDLPDWEHFGLSLADLAQTAARQQASASPEGRPAKHARIEHPSPGTGDDRPSLSAVEQRSGDDTIEALRKRNVAIFRTEVACSAVRDARAKAQSAAEEYMRNHRDESEKDEGSNPGPQGSGKYKNYRRRLAMNRESAAMSRIRRQVYIEELENALYNYEKQRNELLQVIEDLKRTKNDQHERGEYNSQKEDRSFQANFFRCLPDLKDKVESEMTFPCDMTSDTSDLWLVT